MKILVPVKRVIDHNVIIRVKPDGSGVETANVKMSMNPFDENALEEAVQLREAGKAGEVIAVTIGPAQATDTLRAALAMGADRALLVTTETRIEPLAVAKLLREIAMREAVGLVIMGKQAIDDDANQSAQMLAALLGWGQATFASKVTLGAKSVEVEREVDGGTETIVVRLPAVISADLRLNAPRYASLPNIMKAKKHPIEESAPGDYEVDIAPRLHIEKTVAPSPRKSGIMVGSVGELVDRLRNEAGVL